MGTGWRRALCTSVQRDDSGDAHRDAKNKKRRPQDAPTAGGGGAGGFFSAVKSAATGGGGAGGSSSTPSTPTLRCRTKPLQQPAEAAPVTPPSAPAPMRKHRMPLLQALSAPASPRSPSRFALLKASLLPSKVSSSSLDRSKAAASGCHFFSPLCLQLSAFSSASKEMNLLYLGNNLVQQQ